MMDGVNEIPEVDDVESLNREAKADMAKVNAQLARTEVWDVENFVNRDKALISAALDGDRELLTRAAQMLENAETNRRV